MVHWPTQAAINQLTMRAATLALAFAATAAGLVAPSHANCLPGGFCEIEQPYPPELLAAVDSYAINEAISFPCNSIADSIPYAQSQVVAGMNYEYTLNTQTALLFCTTFVPLPVYNTEPTSQCMVDTTGDFGPEFCLSAAGPMPAPGDE